MTAVTSLDTTIADLLRDGLFVDGDWVESKDQDPNGEVRLIQLADIGDGVFRNRSSRFLTKVKADELRCTYLKPGDILVARMPEPLGRACIFPGVGQPAVTAVDVCVMRPNSDRVRAEWLVKAINAPAFRSSMQQFVRGTTRQRISRKNLGTLALDLPSVAQQDATVRFHELAEAKRLSASHHLNSVSADIERLRQAVLSAGCSGQLTDDWREQRRQSGHRPKLPGAPRPIAAAIDTPEEWSWFRLGDVAELQGGIQVGASRRPDRPLRAVPYLRVANVQKGWLDLSEIKTIMAPEETIRLLQLHPGDMLFNEGGDRDKLGRGWIWEGQITECIHQNHVFRGRLHDSRMQPRFYSWYGNTVGMTYFFSEGKQTVNLASLSKTKLSQLPVPVPTIEEQAEIVRRVERLLYLADVLQGRVKVANRKVDRSSQAILAKSLRGDFAGITV